MKLAAGADALADELLEPLVVEGIAALDPEDVLTLFRLEEDCRPLALGTFRDLPSHDVAASLHASPADEMFQEELPRLLARYHHVQPAKRRPPAHQFSHGRVDGVHAGR